MASRRRRMATDEWSCSLCTLLNHWRDRRCAACDTAREQDPDDGGDDAAATGSTAASQIRSQEETPVAAAVTTASVATLLVPVDTLRGVFFSSAPRAQTGTTTTAASGWREEPRLKVNRRLKRPLRQLTIQHATTETSYAEPMGVPSFSLLGNPIHASETGVGMVNGQMTVVEDASLSERRQEYKQQQQNQPVPLPPEEFHSFVEPECPHGLPAQAITRMNEEEGDDEMLDEDESQPCFQLLGPGTAMFPSMTASATAGASSDETEWRSDDSSNRAQNATSVDDHIQHVAPSFNLIDISSSPPLKPPRPVHQTEQHTTTTAVPPEILRQGFVAASRIPISVDNDAVENKMAQAGLNLSDSEEEEDNNRSRRKKLRRNRIQSPEAEDDDDEFEYEARTTSSVAKSVSATWECSVCTNFNSAELSRCELCETKRESDAEDNDGAGNNNQYIDLANSQEEKRQHASTDLPPEYYGFDPRDFENPYDPVQAYEGYVPDEYADLDFVEDISDNEASMAFNRGPTVRPDLKEFEHFVCVEDLATDYGCKIDYRQMFGDSKRGKSYADRLQARKRDSALRRRDEEEKANGFIPRRGKKAATAARQKKRKSTAAAAGESSGRGRTSTAAAGKRRASAPTYTGINHYDTSSVDFGDGVKAKAFLKQESADGTNLYDHLSDVLLKILVERPENLSDSFEYISTAVKQQRYVAPQQSGVAESSESAAKNESKARAEKWCNQALDLLKIKSEEEAAPASGVADLLDEANMFEWAGLGFSKSETFRLSVSLQRLAQTNATTSVHFWGKLLGMGADFYIAEDELSSPSEPEDPDAEEGAAGANKFTYWAMKDDGLYEWVQLPNVRREHILMARQLRRFFKASSVWLSSQFCQLGRGASAVSWNREAFLARTDRAHHCWGGGVSEWVLPGKRRRRDRTCRGTRDQVCAATHRSQQLGAFLEEINAKYGRVTPLPPQTNSDGEEVPWEGEEFAPPLRALSEDAANSWRVDRLPGTLVPTVGEFAVVRSLVWPGAVGIAVGKKFLNVYVGNGVKFSREPYQLQPPKPVQVGFGVGISEDANDGDARPVLRFEPLVEQKDVLEDPSPPEAEE
ncbi:Flagellar radial spoke protein, partial [Globisporangium splendens]